MKRGLQKALKDLKLEKETIPEVFFRHRKSQMACDLFIEWLREKRGEAFRSEVSAFSHRLEEGLIAEDFTFSRKNFYATILSRLKSLGFIALEERLDQRGRRTVKKYNAVYQWVTVKPPQVRGSWLRYTWEIARLWNAIFYDKGEGDVIPPAAIVETTPR